jgi:exoribonuclease-2
MAEVGQRFLVAIADVDALVKKQAALDDHARRNTTSVCTATGIFPMLPEKLSTDFTSLNFASAHGHRGRDGRRRGRIDSGFFA